MNIFNKPASGTNTGGSLFSGLGASNTAQQSTGGFGAAKEKPFFNLGQSATQTTQSGGLFSGQSQQTQQQQPINSFFSGTQTQNQQAGNSFFGTTLNQSQQQQQPVQRPLDQTLRFGFGESQQTAAQAQASKDPWWQEGRGMGVLRSIPQQMELIKDKWDPASLNSPLRIYLYQHVGSESEALKFSPGPGEDPDKWEEAVQKRPGPEWVPVLARGFRELGTRSQKQREAVGHCNMMLNEINNSLDIQLDTHRQKVATRLEESRRRHKAISQRTLALAAKVQILKNRGYVMDNAEEDLKVKLDSLEKEVLDPSIHAREQEIWARMLGIRERARYLKAEMEKLDPTVQQAQEPLLDSDTLQQARKTLSAYDTQLKHLQKEMQLVQEEYSDWERLSRTSLYAR
ncbi:Nucleoporin nup57 [Lithohypha guttulata]|uniref:Nucleoporin nup57 n=1 Tax=Lithohypha guttulata TaxID=1690604 RepID=A0AAN7YHY1_9EURO|nr:Nucleoporin nup57 [Lithohypha guttulata]KAK5101208.1 Nucleoporin nup57 [Lithohypha guttulata]